MYLKPKLKCSDGIFNLFINDKEVKSPEKVLFNFKDKIYPNLILNVFDLPSVIETAKSKISHLGDQSKIKLIPGNFDTDLLMYDLRIGLIF